MSKTERIAELEQEVAQLKEELRLTKLNSTPNKDIPKFRYRNADLTLDQLIPRLTHGAH